MGRSGIQGDTGQTTPSHLLPQWGADHSSPYALTLGESLHTRHRLAHAQTAASHRRLSSRQSAHTTSCTMWHIHAGDLHCTRTTRAAREKCRSRDTEDTNGTTHRRIRETTHGRCAPQSQPRQTKYRVEIHTPQSQPRQTKHRVEIHTPGPPTNFPHENNPE